MPGNSCYRHVPFSLSPAKQFSPHDSTPLFQGDFRGLHVKGSADCDTMLYFPFVAMSFICWTPHDKCTGLNKNKLHT
jgi:hypothetical protein